MLFESSEPALIDKLAQQAVTRLLEPEEILFSEGTADCTLYVIASGVLEVTKAAESGVILPLGTLGAGEYLGEIGLLTGATHAATARARTHCYIHQLSHEAIAPLLEAHPGMLTAFGSEVRSFFSWDCFFCCLSVSRCCFSSSLNISSARRRVSG